VIGATYELIPVPKHQQLGCIRRRAAPVNVRPAASARDFKQRDIEWTLFTSLIASKPTIIIMNYSSTFQDMS